MERFLQGAGPALEYLGAKKCEGRSQRSSGHNAFIALGIDA